MSPQLCWIMSQEIYTQLSHTKSKTVDFWCVGSDGFVCLWLSNSAHKHWHRDLPWTLPHMYRLAHASLISSLRFILPPLQLSVSSHTNVQWNVYFSTQWGGKKRKHSVFAFIKQFVCDYVNALCLIHATVWTSGVRTDCDKFLSFTPVHVCSGWWWLLRHMIVRECLHLNSSHTTLKVIVFLKLKEMREKICGCYRTAKLESCSRDICIYTVGYISIWSVAQFL